MCIRDSLNRDGIIRRQSLARTRYRPTIELIIGQRQGYQGDLLALHKEIEELNIDPAWEYMKEHGIQEIIVHAPYIINLGNAVTVSYTHLDRFSDLN